MNLTAQETLLLYEALRVVNSALSQYKLQLIREYNTRQKDNPELDRTFDVQDAMHDLLQKFENEVEQKKKKHRAPKDGKNERRT